MSNNNITKIESKGLSGNTDVATSSVAGFFRSAGLAVALPFAYLSNQRNGQEAANDALYEIASRIKG